MPSSKKPADNKPPATPSSESLCTKQYKSNTSSYVWYPSVNNVQQIEYVRKLECDYEQLQSSFLSLTTQFARLQFRLRQLMQAQPMEREKLLRDLERIAFEEVDPYGQCKPEELPRIERDNQKMGNIEMKQSSMICRLRGLIADLEEESDCLVTEYRNDPAWELEQKEKCQRKEVEMQASQSLTHTKSKESIKGK
ncbi:RUN domain-containing protein 1 [Musca vetustissima]|uniref:RUN domain-containing protein 1 n=1 Tax=Musca vetustissima TaxID=27455 RepID=UPI002AB6B0F0|nr:RUN domain-containing protein 1 [Musca vetustissima]